MRRYWLIASALIAAGCSDITSPTNSSSPQETAPLTGAVTATGAPSPAGADRILIDTRTSLQQANSRDAALRALGADSWRGSWNVINAANSGLGVTALRLDWPKDSTAGCDRGNAWISSPLPAPAPSSVYVQWKHHLGRTSMSGYGALGQFTLTGSECTSGRTVWSLFRGQDTMGVGTVDYRWTAVAPITPLIAISGASGVARYRPLASSTIDMQSYAGHDMLETMYLQAESAPGAGDGVVRLWIDGQLVIENTAASVGPDAFARMRFPGQSPLTTRQSEFFWDVLVWQPAVAPSTAPTPAPSPSPASVTVSPSSATLTVGDTTRLTATVKDSSGNVMTGQSVTWQSKDTTVAVVSSTGLVTARATGQVVVTATAGSATGSSAITVSAVAVASVAVSPSADTLHPGQTVQLTATTRDANGNVLTGRSVTWSSSADSIATVSASGLVTANAVGTVTITATSEGKSGTASVSVTPVPVASVTVTPTYDTLLVGATVQLTATVRDSAGNVLAGRTVTWVSSNPAVASVNGTGLVTANAQGAATISATSEGKSGAASVTVQPVPVASVAVSPASFSIATGATQQLTATVKDASGNVLSGRTVTWSSSNTSVATVSGSGLVTGQNAGTATITATSEGKSGTSAATVSSPIQSVPQGTYYVSPSGNDANAGTSASAPFRTIQRAADLVNPGDVVVVMDGVWTDEDGNGTVVDINRGGTASAPVIFRSANKWGAKLDGQNGFAHQGFDFNNGVGYVRIEGFEIYGVANVGSPRGSASGIDIYDGGHDVQIVGNHIHDIGRLCTNSGNTNGQVAIFVEQPNVTVEGNLIHDIGRFFPGENGCSYSGGFTGYMTLDHGIYVNGSSPGGNNALIKNNVFYNTRHGWGVQVYPGSLSNIRILNNTFAYCNPNKHYSCIVLDASISGSSVINNVFYNPEGGTTMEIGSNFSGSVTVANNLTSGTAMSDRTVAGLSFSANQVNTDPMFVSASGFDFHLTGGSPAIDRGQTQSAVTIDFDGKLRPRGAAYDIGAFEY